MNEHTTFKQNANLKFDEAVKSQTAQMATIVSNQPNGTTYEKGY